MTPPYDYSDFGPPDYPADEQMTPPNDYSDFGLPDYPADEQMTPPNDYSDFGPPDYPADEQMTPPNDYSDFGPPDAPANDPMIRSDDDSPRLFLTALTAYFTGPLGKFSERSLDMFITLNQPDTYPTPEHPPEGTVELPPWDADVSPPNLRALLSSEYSSHDLMNIYMFFTFSVVSSEDWCCLTDSPFGDAIVSIFEERPPDRLPLAVACLHRVFSPGSSDGPPDSMVSMLIDLAGFAVPLFETARSDASCLSDYVALVTDLMIFLPPDDGISRAAMANFAPCIFDCISNSGVTQLMPSVWDMMHAWLNCADDAATGTIVDFLGEIVVPQLDCLKPKDAVDVSPNLIDVMGDACRGSRDLCEYVNAGTFPSLIYHHMVASIDEDTVLASFAFLEIVVPFMADLTWIAPAWLDYLANEWPEHGDLIFRFGIRAVTGLNTIPDDWWKYAQPHVDDFFSKKVFCTVCFAHWLPNLPRDVSLDATFGLPVPELFVPMLTDLLDLGCLDPDPDGSIRSLLLAYLDLPIDGIAEYLYDMLQDCGIGEALRSIADRSQDQEGALREVLRI
jgi:hypothetical protein